MKKNYTLSLLFILFMNSIFAQFTITRIDGTPVVDNEVIEVTTYGDVDGTEIKLIAYNNSTVDLDFRARCTDLINNTGDNFQICWGFECLQSVSLYSTYPSMDQAIINAGASSLDSFFTLSFKNFNAGDGINYPMDHTFRIFTRELDGTPTGNGLNITYRYQGPLSLEQKDKLSEMGVKVLNTSVSSYVGLEITKEVNYNVINIQGQTILSGKTASNINLELSALQTGLYFLQFQNNEGLADSVKIYKK